MADFNSALAKTLNLEGGYSNNPYDTGGKTMYGITEATARAYGYQGEMRNLSLEFAKDVYRRGYWSSIRLDEVSSQLLAENLFDCGVNCGTKTAIRFLQRALNVLNKRATKWSDIEINGEMNDSTIQCLVAALKSKSMETSLIKLFNVLRGEYYVRIAEKREANEEFMLGWILHRLHIEVRK